MGQGGGWSGREGIEAGKGASGRGAVVVGSAGLFESASPQARADKRVISARYSRQHDRAHVWVWRCQNSPRAIRWRAAAATVSDRAWPPPPLDRHRNRRVRLRQSFEPLGHRLGHGPVSGRPAAHETAIAVQSLGQAPLRPAEQGKDVAETLGCHEPRSLMKAAPAPKKAAPAARQDSATCQTARPARRRPRDRDPAWRLRRGAWPTLQRTSASLRWNAGRERPVRRCRDDGQSRGPSRSPEQSEACRRGQGGGPMTPDMLRRRPPHLVRETTRHGTVVWYVRRGAGPRVRPRAEYDTQAFWQ